MRVMRKSLYLYRTLTNTVTSCEKYFHKDMLSFSKWKEENRKYEEIQRKTEVKTYASGNYDFNVDLTVGKTINYNVYQTHQYSLSDGTVVYCLEPSKANPSNGQYTASVSNDALLSAVAYYGYGGPGYESDKGMYNMLQENVRPYAYVITHMALSWVYDGCSDDSDAFKGNAATADGIKNMVNLMDIDAYLPFHRNTDI